MHRKPIIVTGSEGRIGRYLSESLERSGRSVIRVSRRSKTGTIDYATLLESDILENAEALFHSAWSTVPGRAEKEPSSTWSDDLPLLAKLLDKFRTIAAGSRPLFIYPSSGGAIYGNAPGRPNTEEDPPSPIGWYGIGKEAAENLIASYVSVSGINACVLRVANPYGLAYDPLVPQGLVGAAIAAATNGTTLQIWGDGTARKDYIHMEDLVSAVEAVTSNRIEGTFNLSTGRSVPIDQVLGIIEKSLGRPISRQTHPAASWDVQESSLSPEKLKSATGWRPVVSLEDGLSDLIRKSNIPSLNQTTP